jgi:Tol biopolymer transport system component
LFFDGYNSSSPGIYQQQKNTPGEEVQVVSGNASNPHLSPNGNWLAFSRQDDIFIFDLQKETESLVDSLAGNQWFPSFSPDSRYIAYQSSSATDLQSTYEIIVRPVFGTAYVSFGNPLSARRPVWGPDSKYIYFQVLDDGIYRVSITTEPFFQVIGDPEKIVSTGGETYSQYFDISPDGNTLVFTGDPNDTESRIGAKKYSTIVWWQNWAQSLSDE